MTDANGCTISEVIVLEGTLSVVGQMSDPSCFGGDDGEIIINIFNAAEPVQCEWSTTDGSGLSQFVCDQISLTAGTYLITVTDGNGITTSESFTLTDPDPMVITAEITHITGNSC